MKTIALTHGKAATVDDQDYDWLMQWKWYAEKGGCTFYAVRDEPRGQNGKRLRVRMHREIAAVAGLPEVDHWDGDGLNNQRLNLRPCTTTQNQGNSKKQTGRSSRFKGICWRNDRHRWQVGIHVNSKFVYLGLFDGETEASRAYDRAAGEHFGEFAKLNFPSVV